VRNAEAFETAHADTRILQDLGVNSARLVDIVLAFEDEFGIEIDDATADMVRTSGAAGAAIRERRSA
jgi:acyl carrier protein